MLFCAFLVRNYLLVEEWLRRVRVEALVYIFIVRRQELKARTIFVCVVF